MIDEAENIRTYFKPERGKDYFLDQVKKRQLMEIDGNICPVCGYNKLSEPPYDNHGYPSYEICDCCGFEYGVTDDDQGFTFESYRKKWFEDRCPYFGSTKPEGWSIERAKEQLSNLEPRLNE